MKIDLFSIRSARKFAVVSIITGLIFSISKCTGIDKTDLTILVDKIQRSVNLKFISEDINDNILKNENLLKERIRYDVDSAISKYEDLESSSYTPRMKNQNILKELKNPKYTWQQKLIVKDAVYYEFAPDTSKAQESLGPTMGIRGAWISPDPREIKD
jgi:hypothetical protein